MFNKKHFIFTCTKALVFYSFVFIIHSEIKWVLAGVKVTRGQGYVAEL